MTTPFNQGHQSQGHGQSPKYVVGTYTDVPKVSARGVDTVHMVLSYNAIIVAFSSESDSADNTELRHILSNSEEIRNMNILYSKLNRIYIHTPRRMWRLDT